MDNFSKSHLVEKAKKPGYRITITSRPVTGYDKVISSQRKKR